MTTLPSGTVTFLFTDIEGSTRLVAELGDRYEQVLADHHRLLRQVWAAHGGSEVRTAGDSFFVAFPSAPAAVAAVTEAQHAIEGHAWPAGYPVRVRMGLHTGEAPLSGDDYGGLEVHRAARVAATGHGGQVVLSEATRVLAEAHLPDGVSLRDLGAHRLKDLLAPEPLWQLVIGGLAADFPPLKTLERHPHQLPLMPTSFLGREAEIGRLGELLEANRLVTLTGPGGTGKTRLALQAAAEHIERFGDGAFFVGLAALSDPDLVMSAIAGSLGLRESSGRSLTESVTEYLADKTLLLVVDNLEHLPAAAPRISELLAAAPELRVLATSRAPLHLQGEQEYPVPSLGLPQPGERDPGRLAETESVALFTERATLVDPAFTLTERNAPAVAALVTRLDGLPLAIELAAARVKLLSPGAILARLERRLPALAQGAADAPARQRTLAATIAWSHDLLTPAEQALFRRFSVFAGGATLEALEAVADPGGELGDSLELVASLVDHSLLRRIEQPDGTSRLRMLTVLREDAERRLDEAGETALLRERHVRWCLALAEEAEPELTGPDQVAWLDRLETEHDNLRAALAWAHEGGEGDDERAARAEVGLRIAGAIRLFWEVHGHLREGLRWLVAIQGISDGVAHGVLAKAVNAAGVLAWRQGDFTVARDSLEHAVSLRRQIGDPLGVAKATNNLALVSRDAGDFGQAESLYRESLAAFRAAGDELRSSWVLGNVGTLKFMQGDYPEAARLLTESLAMGRALADTHGVAMALVTLAVVQLEQGDATACGTSLKQAAESPDLLRTDQSLLTSFLDAVGELAAARGAPTNAIRLMAAASCLRASIDLAVTEFDDRRRSEILTAIRGCVAQSESNAAWDDGARWDAATSLGQALAALAEPIYAKETQCWPKD